MTRRIFSLHQHRGGRQLIQEQGPAISALEAAVVRFRRTGESAGFMAKQLGLEQAVADRGAVHLQEIGVPAIGQVVEAGGNQLFAGATFANNEYRFLQRRDLGDVFQHLEESRCFANQSVSVPLHRVILANCW